MTSPRPEIFLSYSREDQAGARRFAESLQREGFQVWWDQALTAGDSFDKVTEQTLKEAKAVVVLWSRRSVDSRWVRSEATLADRYGTLVPVMIEPCDRPIMFELTHTADLSGWKGDAADPSWQSFVEGLRRFVQREGASTAAPELKQRPAVAERTGSGVLHRRAWPLVSAVVIAAAIGIGVFLYWNGRDAAPARELPVTLAVLPFINLSADPEQEYFSDGLTEELLNALAQVRDLRVTGRTSSFSYKGKNEDLRVIAAQLGVAHLLEGSIRKEGKTLRITAQLIEGRDGSHLWSKTYDRVPDDALMVQEEIARDVAQRLSVTLDVGELSRSRGGTINPEAFDKYLRAAQLRPLSGRETLRQRRLLLRSAVELDPDFAAAWYDLDVTLLAIVSLLPDQREEARREHAEILSRIDNLPADAWQTHALRSVLLRSQRSWAEAESEASTAWRAAPRPLLGTSNFYLDLLHELGRDPLELIQQAQLADPNSLTASVNLQLAYAGAGRFAEADREYERSRTLSGDHGVADVIAAIRFAWNPRSKTPAGQQELRRLYTSPDTSFQPEDRALAQLRVDDPERALALVRERINEPFESWATNYPMVADWLGAPALVLQGIRRALTERPDSNLFTLWIPSHSGFRSDPAFKQLLRELKIADYFRVTGNWGQFCKPAGADDFECR